PQLLERIDEVLDFAVDGLHGFLVKLVLIGLLSHREDGLSLRGGHRGVNPLKDPGQGPYCSDTRRTFTRGARPDDPNAATGSRAKRLTIRSPRACEGKALDGRSSRPIAPQCRRERAQRGESREVVVRPRPFAERAPPTTAAGPAGKDAHQVPRQRAEPRARGQLALRVVEKALERGGRRDGLVREDRRVEPREQQRIVVCRA